MKKVKLFQEDLDLADEEENRFNQEKRRRDDARREKQRKEWDAKRKAIETKKKLRYRRQNCLRKGGKPGNKLHELPMR